MEWNGDGWGLLWSSVFTAFQELDRDGSPIGGLRWLGRRGAGGELLWSGGRYGTLIARAGDLPHEKVFGLLDARGVQVTPWTDLRPYLPGVHPQLARVEHLNRWLVVEGHDGPLNVVELDGEATIVGQRELAPMASSGGADVAALKSRAVVFYCDPNTPVAHVLTVPVEASSAVPIRLSEDEVCGGDATRLRDAAVWLANRDGSGSADIFVVDPFSGDAERHGLEPLGEIREVAGIDRYDLLAVCSSRDDPEAHDDLWLTILDRSGQRVGRSVRLSSGERTWRQCALGIDGDRIFAAWNDYYGQRLLVRGFRIRTE